MASTFFHILAVMNLVHAHQNWQKTEKQERRDEKKLIKGREVERSESFHILAVRVSASCPPIMDGFAAASNADSVPLSVPPS